MLVAPCVNEHIACMPHAESPSAPPMHPCEIHGEYIRMHMLDPAPYSSSDVIASFPDLTDARISFGPETGLIHVLFLCFCVCPIHLCETN